RLPPRRRAAAARPASRITPRRTRLRSARRRHGRDRGCWRQRRSRRSGSRRWSRSEGLSWGFGVGGWEGQGVGGGVVDSWAFSGGLSGKLEVMNPEILEIPLERIRPNPYQPRVHFAEEAMEELAATIREHGVLQPVVVRRAGAAYVLIAGERRLRAAERAGLEMIPAIVRDVDERQMLEMALVENIQREDINPVEAARAYQRLAEEFGLTHAEIARRTGKSRSAVVNTMRLLQLPPDVLTEVEEGRLSEGHGRALLVLADNALRREFSSHISREGVSVREAEQAALQYGEPSGRAVSRETSRTEGTSADPFQKDLVDRLRRHLGTKVALHYRNGKGSLSI